jgi:hypothetical protein
MTEEELKTMMMHIWARKEHERDPAQLMIDILAARDAWKRGEKIKAPEWIEKLFEISAP